MTSFHPSAVETLLRDNHRLLRETGALPPTGAGTVAWKSPDGEGLLLADLYPLGPFGDGSVVTHPLASVPGHLASAAAAHALVHRLRPEIGASILARPLHLASWALAHRALPVRYSPILRASDAPEIPVTGSGLRGGTDPLAATLTAHPGIKAVLIADHGVLVLGRDLPAVTRLLIALEETADLTRSAEALGGTQPFPDDAAERTARGIAGNGL
jgi:L-fuculose-phosphate aldolase